jgi:hypothetical protein
MTKRKFEILYPQAAPTQTELLEIETLVGTELDHEFKEFLQFGNGGIFPYYIDVLSEGKEDVYGFVHLFSTHRQYDNDNYYIPAMTHHAREIYEIPDQILPIAQDDGGQMLFLDLSSNTKGRLVTFDLELSWKVREDDRQITVLVANSFAEYLNKLYPLAEFEEKIVKSNESRRRRRKDRIVSGDGDNTEGNRA